MPSPPADDDDDPVRGDVEDADSVFRTAVTVELSLGFVAIALGWLTDVDVRQWLPSLALDQLAAIGSSILWGLAAALPMLAVVELVERSDWAPLRELRELDRLPIVATLLRLRPLELVTISIAAGVGEELLLRGWLLGWLVDPLESATPLVIASGLLVSSIAFGLMHPVTPAYIVLASLIGLYLGGIVLWTGDLLIAIVAHASYDAAHLLLARRANRKSAT